MDDLVNAFLRTGVLKSAHIEKALRAVDRADFVPEEYAGEAYRDTPMPIGYGQTISQPYTVVFMLELLAPRCGERILDVGSGSGWTTALLAHIVGAEGKVYGVELVPELVEIGKQNLAKYSFPHASIEQAGNRFGLLTHTPFDRILVSAAANDVPKELVAQLRDGGNMVLPVRDAIWRVHKDSTVQLDMEKHKGFAFVPLLEP